MRTDPESLQVDCLHDTITLLLCSEDPVVIWTVERLVAPNAAFRLVVARCERTARHRLRDHRPVSVLLVDSGARFGLRAVHLTNECEHWLPIVILSRSRRGGPMDASVWKQLEVSVRDGNDPGPWSLVTVCPLEERRRLLATLQVKGLLTRLVTRFPGPRLRRAIQVLFAENPRTVLEWCGKAEMASRTLQRQTAACTTLTLKRMLQTFHGYRQVFAEASRRLPRPRPRAIQAHLLECAQQERVVVSVTEEG